MFMHLTAGLVSVQNHSKIERFLNEIYGENQPFQLYILIDFLDARPLHARTHGHAAVSTACLQRAQVVHVRLLPVHSVLGT